jgi:hypothetical protein
MRPSPRPVLSLALGAALALGCLAGTPAPAAAQPAPSLQSPAFHARPSIDQELARLTRDLELTPTQVREIRPLLQKHHDRIQALFERNPALSRQQLFPQIHAISAETHREIGALLTGRQKQLVKAMIERLHNGQESRFAG